MVFVYVDHEVVDYNAWRQVFDEVKTLRESGGELSARVFQEIDNPGKVSVLVEFESVEKAKEFFSNEQLMEAMKRSGVMGEPTFQYLEEVS